MLELQAISWNIKTACLFFSSNLVFVGPNSLHKFCDQCEKLCVLLFPSPRVFSLHIEPFSFLASCTFEAAYSTADILSFWNEAVPFVPYLLNMKEHSLQFAWNTEAQREIERQFIIHSL